MLCVMCKTQGNKYSHHSLVEDELLNFIPIFRYQWTCHGCQDTPFLLLSFRAERQNGIDRPTYVVKILSTWEKKNVYFPHKEHLYWNHFNQANPFAGD